jgi:hypothetical protein
MQMDTQRLLKGTIGIQDVVYPSACNYLVQKRALTDRSWRAEPVKESV